MGLGPTVNSMLDYLRTAFRGFAETLSTTELACLHVPLEMSLLTVFLLASIHVQTLSLKIPISVSSIGCQCICQGQKFSHPDCSAVREVLFRLLTLP